jgi:hypothetical protein
VEISERNDDACLLALAADVWPTPRAAIANIRIWLIENRDE